MMTAKIKIRVMRNLVQTIIRSRPPTPGQLGAIRSNAPPYVIDRCPDWMVCSNYNRIKLYGIRHSALASFS